jgi:hypothetical protein
LKKAALCSHTPENCTNPLGKHIPSIRVYAKPTEVIRVARKGRRLQPKRPERGSVTRVTSAALGARLTRGTRNQAGELLAEEENAVERELPELDTEVTFNDNIREPKMGAAASKTTSIQHNSTRFYARMIAARDKGVEWKPDVVCLETPAGESDGFEMSHSLYQIRPQQ